MSTKNEIRKKGKTKSESYIPKKYKVVIYNDDFTPMDFVVEILIYIFQKRYQQAVTIMMEIHKGTKAIVGIYSYDIAHSKAGRAMALGKEKGYPLRVMVEKA